MMVSVHIRIDAEQAAELDEIARTPGIDSFSGAVRMALADGLPTTRARLGLRAPPPAGGNGVAAAPAGANQ
jgi:hypothetical protein